MENFAVGINALNKYSIFSFDAKRSQFHLNLNKAATFIHAGPGENVTSFFFF